MAEVEHRKDFMDAIALLKADHRSVEKLFQEFESAGDRAFATKAKVVSEIIRALFVHAEIEELLFCPAASKAAAPTKSMVLESLEEHLGVKRLLADLEEMEPTDERFDAKVIVLIEQVRHHVSEEEDAFSPRSPRGSARDVSSSWVTSWRKQRDGADPAASPRP